MQHSPSAETNMFSVVEKFPAMYGNPKVHYLNHNSPPPVPILSHLDSAHDPTSNFLKIHLNSEPAHTGSKHSTYQISCPIFVAPNYQACSEANSVTVS